MKGSPTGYRDRRLDQPFCNRSKGSHRNHTYRLHYYRGPVQIGLVASLNRPGGNLTGVTILNVEIVPKMLELLHEVVPTATTMAALVNPTNPNADTWSTGLQVAARTLGLELNVLRASTERDIDEAFATLIPLRVGGLVIVNDVFLITREEQLAALALRHKLPTIFQSRESAWPAV